MDTPTVAIAVAPVVVWLSSLAAAAVLYARGARREGGLVAMVAFGAWLPLPAGALVIAALAALGLGSRQPADAVSWWLLPAWASLAACLIAAPLAWAVALATMRFRDHG